MLMELSCDKLIIKKQLFTQTFSLYESNSLHGKVLEESLVPKPSKRREWSRPQTLTHSHSQESCERLGKGQLAVVSSPDTHSFPLTGELRASGEGTIGSGLVPRRSLIPTHRRAASVWGRDNWQWSRPQTLTRSYSQESCERLGKGQLAVVLSPDAHSFPLTGELRASGEGTIGSGLVPRRLFTGELRVSGDETKLAAIPFASSSLS